MKRLIQVSAAAFAAAALAAPALAATVPAQASHVNATTIQVRGGEFYFKLSATSAPRGTVTFIFRNVGQVAHDFKINGKKTPSLSPGKSARLVVRFTKAGKYPLSCTIPGHAQAGMKGTFTIR
jgi:uncharacterized cupredoxin-like copper-binding protein